MKNLINYIFEKLTLSQKKSYDADPNDPTTWDVGDILWGTFGYNMTLPMFFKIIKKTPSGFTTVKLSKKLVDGAYNSSGGFYEVPDDSQLEHDLKGKQYRTIIKPGKKYIRIDDIGVRLWNEEPVWGNDMD